MTNAKSGPIPSIRFPAIIMRDETFFPSQKRTLFVGRKKSTAALELAKEYDNKVYFITLKNEDVEDPYDEDLYEAGVVARIESITKEGNDVYKVVVVGEYSALFTFVEYEEDVNCYMGDTIRRDLRVDPDDEDALSFRESILTMFRETRSLQSASFALSQLKEEAPVELFIATAVQDAKIFDTKAKQVILEKRNHREQLREIHKRIKIIADKENPKDGAHPHGKRRPPEGLDESEEIIKAIESLDANNEVRSRLRKEAMKLSNMQQLSAEATVLRNYIDWLLSLPWNVRTKDVTSMVEAEKILEDEHYGLEKPKERILEFLAVQSLVNKLKGPILCFVGPPGVGKTSLAASVANAMGRNFVRMSLGGVRDEAEIRGHRRTYVGAMPGKIIQMMRRAKSSNPVFLLDEIDKLGSDHRGDPSSALLEVLDPEQNTKFVDHYLDLDFDLSDVIFIATANYLEGIPLALRDRMEIIEIDSYTEYEKLQIAKTYLVPKQIEANGILPFNVRFTDAALRTIIQNYTFEAGVRSLEREISSVCRKIAIEILKKEIPPKSITITHHRVNRLLGTPKIRERKIDEHDEVGITTGLAVTRVGGTILKSEVAVVQGSGKLIITGQLKDLMQESAQAALSYVRSRAHCLGLEADFPKNIDIHIHFPGDHAPKDGPSAGITMATSLISALTNIPVYRQVAMTGEITLRGRVLAIGGVRDKLLAAKRHGITTVIIPKDNMRDVEDIAPALLQGLQVKAVATMDEVVTIALKMSDEEKKQFKTLVDNKPLAHLKRKSPGNTTKKKNEGKNP